jgi:alpha/beta superfamily hydrolase
MEGDEKMNQIYLGDEKKVYLCEYLCENSKISVIILPNIGWYHTGPNRIFPNLAKLCNDEQINAFCFDYIGSGESYGTYEDMTYENMKLSFLNVYKYIQQKYNNSVCVIGYGAGNILLRDLARDYHFVGVIYYLPRFENVLKYKDEVLNDENVKKNGCYNVQVTKEPSDYVFWRSILGEIHDCTYNPISYHLVNELCSSLEQNLLKESCVEHVLLIRDSETEEVKKDFDYLVIPEFKDNVVPADWYKTCNLWPDTLLSVNLKIVEWLKGLSKETVRSDEKEEIVSGKTFITQNGIREIVSFDSDGRKLFGVLHLPTDRSKKVPCILFIPGLGGDKVDNFMCGPRLADHASKNDIAMFRYDNRYSGASDSPLTEYTNTGIAEDFKNAFEALQKYNDVIDMNNIILVSWSNGAKLSSYIVSQKMCNVKMCIFWNAVFIDANIEQKYKDKENMGRNMTRYKKNRYGQLVTQIGGEYLGMQYNCDNRKFDFSDLFQKMDVLKKYVWGDYDMDSTEYQYVSENEKDARSFCLSSKHHLFSYESINEVINATINFIKEEF